MEGQVLLKWMKENGYGEKTISAYNILISERVRNIPYTTIKDRQVIGFVESLPAPRQLESKTLSSLQRTSRLLGEVETYRIKYEDLMKEFSRLEDKTSQMAFHKMEEKASKE